MTNYADLELGLHRYDGGSYTIELRYSQPDIDTDVRLGHGNPIQVSLDPAKMAALNPDEYGKQLNEALFSNADLKVAFSEALANAQSQGLGLRLRILIGQSAEDLHNVHWENLLNPNDGSPISTNQNILLSRYMSSMDWRPVRLLPRGSLSCLAVVANPSNIASAQLAAIDSPAELELVRNGLPNISVNTCQGSLAALTASLQNGPVDVLYLVCHGYIANGQTILCLEKPDGSLARTPGSELVTALKQQTQQPRLVVLVSCQSAGDGTGAALTSLAPRLAEIGIPAVIAMQANISMASAKLFLPAFFSALNQDGQIDRAMSSARNVIKAQDDVWVPVLFMRLKSGRLWYVPGFGDANAGIQKLPSIIRYIEEGQCTPLIGPGLAEPVLGSMRDIATRWAERFRYPMSPNERESLPQVAQYLTIHQDANFPFLELKDTLVQHLVERYGKDLPDELKQGRPDLNKLMDAVGGLQRARDPNDPHKQLADLHLPIYITANQDNLLESALTAAGHPPISMNCPWTQSMARKALVLKEDPTPDNPLVYHLFGSWSDRNSIVLTEDNYFDFLIGVTSNNDVIPEQVGLALSNSSLLFLGFQTQDWNFRVLYRSVLAKPGSARRSSYTQIAAQIEPEDGRILEPIGARKYLQDYFGKNSDIDIFWGSPQDFLNEIMKNIQPGGAQ
jgi:hypothetical protein